MPNPAAIEALRDYQWFGGHAAGLQLLVLALWAAVPVVVMAVLALRSGGGARESRTDLVDASGAALAAGGPV